MGRRPKHRGPRARWRLRAVERGTAPMRNGENRQPSEDGTYATTFHS
jgi:hypothetical protein